MRFNFGLLRKGADDRDGITCSVSTATMEYLQKHPLEQFHEEQWAAYSDPLRMVYLLYAATPGLARDGVSASRKLRLFHCAVARQEVQRHAPTSRLIRGVVLSEVLADQLLSDQRPDHVRLQEQIDVETRELKRRTYKTSPTLSFAYESCTFLKMPFIGMLEAADAVTQYSDSQLDKSRFPDLLRDLVPNPFRPPPTFYKEWLYRNDNAVFLLAQEIYYDYRFDLMPKLADALEKAGCDDTTIIDHCRGTSPHIRGCWVVDGLLKPYVKPDVDPMKQLLKRLMKRMVKRGPIPGDRLAAYLMTDDPKDPFTLYRG